MNRRNLLGLVAAGTIVGGASAGAFLHYMSPGASLFDLKSAIGGPFAMTTQLGERLTDKDLKGKPFGIFFGFTQCPDVCPTSMLRVANLLQSLGPDGENFRFAFVTVDPERGTQDLLRDYLSSFDKRIIGLRGTSEETARIVKAYRVFYEKVPTKEGYTINHTALIYVMDRSGRFAKTLTHDESEQVWQKKARSLLDAKAPSTE